MSQEQIEIMVEETLRELREKYPKSRFSKLFAAMGTLGKKSAPATPGEIAHDAGYPSSSVYSSIERLTKALVKIESPFRVCSARINRQTNGYYIGLAE